MEAFIKSLNLFEKNIENYTGTLYNGKCMTLALDYLVVTLIGPFKHFIDKKMRLMQFPALTKFMRDTALKNREFKEVFGANFEFCDTAKINIESNS